MLKKVCLVSVYLIAILGTFSIWVYGIYHLYLDNHPYLAVFFSLYLIEKITNAGLTLVKGYTEFKLRQEGLRLFKENHTFKL